MTESAEATWISGAALSSLRVDVCVVGSGPVGLPLAVSLAEKGLRVLLLEAGTRYPDSIQQSRVSAQIADGLGHAPMNVAVCRAFGGTSWYWGGRCIPLDAIDFTVRPWIPESGWPLGEDDVASYYPAAAAALDCGPGGFEHPERCAGTEGLNLNRLERWSNKPLLAWARNDRPLPNNLFICCETVVTDISIMENRKGVEAITVASGGATVRFDKAAAFVLACGGLETARLLLNVQARQPQLFGGPDGPLGRHYMGHLSGHIANVIFSDPLSAALFAYRDENHSVIRRRMTLNAQFQKARRLPNISFAPDNPKMSDPNHGSGILSAIFVLLYTPAIGSRLISEAIRQMQMKDEPRFLRHLRNIFLDLPRFTVNALDLLWQRLVIGRRKPFLFLHSRSGEYPLHYHAEHIGNANSRVLLAEQIDTVGLRRLRIEQKYTQEDAEGVVRAHRALDEELQSGGLGRLVYYQPEEQRPEGVLAQAYDGFHQMGLTRMGWHEQDGVVDRDCRVFGLENLFLAGTGIFRTSGQANPTFFATALALRLADHIARILCVRG